jgi:hypothetical protein
MRWSIVGIAMILSPGAGASGTEDVDLTGAKSMTADGELNALDGEDRDIARRAAEVLAEELGVPISEIQVDTVRAVEWRDSSIGCPQPGQAYLQVITPGHKITLRHGGRIHTVHEAGGRAFVCRQRKDPTRPTGQIDLVWGPQALVARSDLAERLGVAPESIIIAGATKTRFPDAGLDCPEPGVEYAPDERDGFVLRLRHGGRNYTYHTDLERTVMCPAISAD